MQCTKPVFLAREGLNVPCGKCMACRIARSREWTTRLIHELSYWDKASFATLTYDKEHLPSDNSLSVRHWQLFMKRLRKQVEPLKLKFFASGEYGDRFGRPHYHAIIFGLDFIRDAEIIRDCWPNGFVHLGSVTPDSIRYTTDYILKKYSGKKAQEEYGNRKAPFCKSSQALGKAYALDQAEHIKRRMGCTHRGFEVGIPRYYKKKLNIDTEQLAQSARDSFSRQTAVFVARAGGNEVKATQERINSRKQRESDLEKKAVMFDKGKL